MSYRDAVMEALPKPHSSKGTEKPEAALAECRQPRDASAGDPDAAAA
jgi:hypothetical protein